MPPLSRPCGSLPYALQCLCAVLVVFALNLGGSGTAIGRDINQTDETVWQASPAEPTAHWMGNAPGDDKPDAQLLPAPFADLAAHRAPRSVTPVQAPPATLPRGPSARAPPRPV